MTSLTRSIPVSRKKAEKSYSFHFKGSTREYSFELEPHGERALLTYCSAFQPLVEYIDVEKQPFGIRVNTTPYETELEAWALPVSEPFLSEDEEKMLAIQAVFGAILSTVSEMHDRIRSLNDEIRTTLDELKRSENSNA